MEWRENIKFKLFGSRAKGTARPDSDWDVVVILPIKIKSRSALSCDVDFAVAEVVGWENIALDIDTSEPDGWMWKEARKQLSIPDKDKLDLFVHYVVQTDDGREFTCVDRLIWSVTHQCFAGWVLEKDI